MKLNSPKYLGSVLARHAQRPTSCLHVLAITHAPKIPYINLAGIIHPWQSTNTTQVGMGYHLLPNMHTV